MNNRIRKIDTNGIITTIIETGTNGYISKGIVVDKDGNIYFAYTGDNRVKKITHTKEGLYTGAAINTPSKDGSVIYGFNEKGKHMTTIDSVTGKIIYKFTYDTNGLLSQIEDINKDITTIERNSAGNMTAILSPFGHRTEFTLDVNGYLASVKNEAGSITKYTYSSNGLMQTSTDPKGTITNFVYDSDGRLLKDEKAGNSVSLTKTKDGKTTTIITATTLGSQKSYKTEVKDDGSIISTNTCLGSGLTTTSVKTKAGFVTTTMPDGTISTYKEGPDTRWGKQSPIPAETTLKMPSGLTSVTTLTSAVELTDPNDKLSIKTMNSTINVNGKTYTSAYDAATKTSTVTSPMGKTGKNIYDEYGRVIRTEIPGIYPVEYVYDNHGRILSSKQGDRVISVIYDNKDNVESVEDSDANKVKFGYDAIGRVLQTTNPDNKTIGFRYDLNGNTEGITPPGKEEHTFNYNTLDYVTGYNPPKAGLSLSKTQYEYNLDKQLTQITRPDGKKIDFSYFKCGMVKTMIASDTAITYSRNISIGGKASDIRTDKGVNLSYTYDGQLTKSETTTFGAVNNVVSYDYDNDFRVTGITVNGVKTAYTYDNDSMITNAGNLVLTYNSANGFLNQTTLGKIATSQGYNNYGEITTINAIYNGNTKFYDVEYTYDKSGRIVTKRETVLGADKYYEYGYDLSGQLISVKLNGEETKYEYDSNGNRTGKTKNGIKTTGTYDAQDRMVSYGGNSYEYTANGELTAKTVSGKRNEYTYDVFGNLTKVVLPNGKVIEYIIDGRNRRIGKKVDGLFTEGYIYSGQLAMVAKTDGNGTVTERYYPGYVEKSGVVYRIIIDHLGSPRVAINSESGEIAAAWDWDEYGNLISSKNSDFLPFGLAGGLRDADTGLTRFGARDYDSETGRWTEKEPLGFRGSNNFYSYCNGDPINCIDRDGKMVTIVAGALIGAVTNGISAYAMGKSPEQILTSALIGAGVGIVSGILPIPTPAVQAFIVNILYGTIFGAVGNTAGQVFVDHTNVECLNLDSIKTSAIVGGAASTFVGLIGLAKTKIVYTTNSKHFGEVKKIKLEPVLTPEIQAYVGMLGGAIVGTLWDGAHD